MVRLHGGDHPCKGAFHDLRLTFEAVDAPTVSPIETIACVVDCIKCQLAVFKDKIPAQYHYIAFMAQEVWRRFVAEPLPLEFLVHELSTFRSIPETIAQPEETGEIAPGSAQYTVPVESVDVHLTRDNSAGCVSPTIEIDALPYGIALKHQLFSDSRFLVHLLDPLGIEDVISTGVSRDVTARMLAVVMGAVSDEDTRDCLIEVAASLRMIDTALKNKRIESAFAPIVDLVIAAVRVQSPGSLAQLQLHLAFAHLCRMCGDWDRFYRMVDEVASECFRRMRTEGNVPPDSPGGASLCELGAIAEVNRHNYAVNWIFSSAGMPTFAVKDLASLILAVQSYRQLCEAYCRRRWLVEYEVGFLAHLVNGLETLTHSMSIEWRSELEYVATRFLSSGEREAPNVKALVHAATCADGPCAARRNLEVLADVLAGIPRVADELRRESRRDPMRWRPIYIC